MTPNGLATLIGSFPHDDPNEALDLISRSVPNALLWPQLPKRNWREGLVIQFVEGIPGLIEFPGEARVMINKGKNGVSEAMSTFYEAAMAGPGTRDYSYFALGEAFACGILPAKRVFSDLPSPPEYVKLQTTGPITMGLSILDENGIPILFDDSYYDIVLQNVIMKSLWQIRLFKPFAKDIICFIDEPVLASYGSSAYINVSKDQVERALSDVVNGIKNEGALVGVHVCGNSEWPLVLGSGADILSFDAYNYGESVSLYADVIQNHLETGGCLAWGIVPTRPHVPEENAVSLHKKLTHLVDHLSGHGVDKDLIWEQTMITPSCGMGTLEVTEAESVAMTLKELAQRVQDGIGRFL